MTADELLAQWSTKSKTVTTNIAGTEHFFRRHLLALQTTPEGYARVFDALNGPINWKNLHTYERSLMTDVIETTGLYAARAGRSMCKKKRPVMLEWENSIRNALAPLIATSAMQPVLKKVMINALNPAEKLSACKQVACKDWLAFHDINQLLNLLPPPENLRLAHLPWTAGLDLDSYKKLAALACPTIFPTLDTLLSSEQWGSRSIIMGAADRLVSKKKKPDPLFALPEDFEP